MVQKLQGPRTLLLGLRPQEMGAEQIPSFCFASSPQDKLQSCERAEENARPLYGHFGMTRG